MADGKLQDPELPAGAIVATAAEDDALAEGQVRRNDGVVLEPAAKNPWYVLATIAGEYETTGSVAPGYDLAVRNRRFWNGWACAQMDEPARAALAQELGLPVEELAPLSAAERQTLEAQFAGRLGPDVPIPAPSDTIDCRETHFPHTVVWGRCAVSADAAFDCATFSGWANFRSATFRGRAGFGSATFSGPADFWSATFKGWADFPSTTFRQDVFFDSATFRDLSGFGSATFGGSADFSDAAFGAQSDFKNARFLGEVPKFYHCELHQDTNFTTAVSHWPRITPEIAEDGKRAYTRLRQLMLQLDKPDDAHFFFRQEMRCKEFVEDHWWNRVPITLFRWLSDYGYSVARPGAGLALAWLVPGFAYLFHFFAGGIIAGTAPVSLLGPFGLSFANLFAFLGLHRLYFGDVLTGLPGWLQTLAGAQTVAGVVLLFFLGLGLRNRFRLQ